MPYECFTTVGGHSLYQSGLREGGSDCLQYDFVMDKVSPVYQLNCITLISCYFSGEENRVLVVFDALKFLNSGHSTTDMDTYPEPWAEPTIKKLLLCAIFLFIFSG